jgi:toxin ParE1/3/4
LPLVNVPRRMSGHSLRLRLTPEAREDLEHIFLYGLERWDVDQAERYEQSIHDVIVHIQRHPEIGQSLWSSRPEIRSFRAQHHMVYYRVRDEMVEVLRVLHERQHVSKLTFWMLD